jgi:valyl-tRNA synthetase
MDEGISDAVREVFVRLHEQGLIYRGERIINWCPRCQTALSDLEVIPTERRGYFWHIKYQVENSDELLNIATTRPETLLGDSAVAVHPDDERYKHLHGKNVILPLLGRVIPIITDSYVDKEFGSGALKITPAHDFNDNELGKKHNLSVISVMGKDGKITPAGGPYAGLKFSEARERVIEDLKTSGHLIKTEDHTHKIGLCQRCEHVAEPLISKQWFVKIAPLAAPAIDAVKNNKIVFVPKTWEKTYFEWMNNIRDWCISRQLWWGHQIPAWYCNQCQEITVARQDPTACKHCKAPAKDMKQDEDVLDTWFSSSLWPFATLGWPKKTKALETFYPTNILETGFDIIFFWVARMIMMGIHFMGDVPFYKVYLHAMVRDEKGEKMSKSKGNVIDPLDIINIHGADPLRFTLAIMAGQGRDIKLSVDRVTGYRAFCNKLWNAYKFFQLQIDSTKIKEPAGGLENWIHTHRADLLISSRWIISRLQSVIQKSTSGIENFELNESAQGLYEFVWHEFCDWYIELSKLPLKEDGLAKIQTIYVLHYVLGKVFTLLHPFIPFVTEELWQALPWKGKAKTIMLHPYPIADQALKDVDAEHTVHAIRAVIDALRNFRGEHNISPKADLSVIYIPGTPASDTFMRMFTTEIKTLARIGKIEQADKARPKAINEAIVPLTTPPIELRINMEGLVDSEVETKRLKKEIEKIANDIIFVEEKLGRESFVTKAPPELVEKEKRRKLELISKRTELEAALNRLTCV